MPYPGELLAVDAREVGGGRRVVDQLKPLIKNGPPRGGPLPFGATWRPDKVLRGQARIPDIQ